MPTLQQVREKANAKLSDMWTKLQTRQDAYLAKHGKYFQLLAGSALSNNGEDTTFSVVSPNDEQHIQDIDYAWSETVPFQLEVHEWVGSSGNGYRAIVTINHGSSYYRRERDSNNTDSGWYQLTVN